MILLTISQDDYHSYVKTYFTQGEALSQWCVEHEIGPEAPIVKFDHDSGAPRGIEFDNEAVAVAFKMRWLS